MVLRNSGFVTNSQGNLADGAGREVLLTLVANAANSSHIEMASIVREDLRQLGIRVNVVPLEFRSMVDRVLNRRDFEVALMALRPGDPDPHSDMNVLTSTGKTRLWNMSGQPSEAWEKEIDEIMAAQLAATDATRRKAMFDRVQRILAEHLPFVCLVSPNVLAAARTGLGNFRPAPADAPALWNVDELYWRDAARRAPAASQ